MSSGSHRRPGSGSGSPSRSCPRRRDLRCGWGDDGSVRVARHVAPHRGSSGAERALVPPPCRGWCAHSARSAGSRPTSAGVAPECSAYGASARARECAGILPADVAGLRRWFQREGSRMRSWRAGSLGRCAGRVLLVFAVVEGSIRSDGGAARPTYEGRSESPAGGSFFFDPGAAPPDRPEPTA